MKLTDVRSGVNLWETRRRCFGQVITCDPTDGASLLFEPLDAYGGIMGGDIFRTEACFLEPVTRAMWESFFHGPRCLSFQEASQEAFTEEAQEELQDYRDAAKVAADETCTAGERHCTCVPLLRATLSKVIKERDSLRSQLTEAIKDKDAAEATVLRQAHELKQQDAKLAALRSQLTEAQEKLKKFGLLDEQLSSYKEQWKRHYEKEYQKRFREDTETTYNAIHRIAAALNLDEYDAKDVADAACAALHSTASP